MKQQRLLCTCVVFEVFDVFDLRKTEQDNEK